MEFLLQAREILTRTLDVEQGGIGEREMISSILDMLTLRFLWDIQVAI